MKKPEQPPKPAIRQWNDTYRTLDTAHVDLNQSMDAGQAHNAINRILAILPVLTRIATQLRREAP